MKRFVFGLKMQKLHDKTMDLSGKFGGKNDMKKLLSLEGKTKEQICKEFIEVCKNGTSKDCSKFVYEAKRNGVSYEELCEYKRSLGEQKDIQQ